MCFGCSKEPSHRDGSFEYPQHMFWLRNKKINFQLHTLIWRPGVGLSLSDGVSLKNSWLMIDSSIKLDLIELE